METKLYEIRRFYEKLINFIFFIGIIVVTIDLFQTFFYFPFESNLTTIEIVNQLGFIIWYILNVICLSILYVCSKISKVFGCLLIFVVIFRFFVILHNFKVIFSISFS